VSGISCSGESAASGSSTTVTVAAGENAECTITNTRKGSITVTKDLVPDTDPGRFDLQVDSDVVADEAGDNGSGTKGGLAPGSYTVSELAGSTSPTTLANYVITTSCTGESGPASGSSQSVTVSAGENVQCTITNTRIRVPDAPVIDTTPQCLRRPVIAFVRGKRIKKVVFYLDGRKIDTVTKKDAKKRYATLIQQKLLADGPHKLRAKITFFYTKKVWWLRATLKRCLNQAPPKEIVAKAVSDGDCPTRAFLAYVKGETISSVRYTLNGKRLKTRRVANWKKRYFVKIDPAQLTGETNVLEAHIRFITGTKKSPITLTKELPSCETTPAKRR
jgi:hypothetical protein